MIRIMGNSTERVQLKDLNDVIYYKQVKEFTDTEFGISKDLRRELNAGRLISLEKTEAPRGSDNSIPSQVPSSGSSISLSDIRALLRENLPVSNGEDIKTAIKDSIPLIAEMIRQEISKIPVQQGFAVSGNISSQIVNTSSSILEPTYVPTISSKGMISNIEVKKDEASSGGANEALKALRKMNKIAP